MARYKTKPCEIEAIQYTVDNLAEILQWGKGKINFDIKNGNIYIDTLEGRMRADVYDYIIKGLRGEYYPCKPDVFEKKYEAIQLLFHCLFQCLEAVKEKAVLT